MRVENDAETRMWAKRQGLKQLLFYFEAGSDSCNLNCTYCYVRKTGAYARMSVPLLRQAVDFAREYSIVDKPKIHVFGMEPTRPWDLLVELRRYAADLPLSITTNGTLLNDERISWLVENDVRVYVYSIDGGPHHNRHRVDAHGRPTWNRAAENLRKLCATPQARWVTARATWDPGHDDDYDLVSRFSALEALGVRSIAVVPATDTDTVWDERRVEAAYLALGEYYRWGRTPSKHINEMLDRMLDEPNAPQPGNGCGTGTGYWAVFPPHGQLALCQAYLTNPTGWIGDVWKGITNPLPFLAISDRVDTWHTALNPYPKQGPRYDCRQCHAYRHCMGCGWCAGIHLQHMGDELLPPDNYCAHLRGMVAAMRRWASEHKRRYPVQGNVLGRRWARGNPDELDLEEVMIT